MATNRVRQFQLGCVQQQARGQRQHGCWRVQGIAQNRVADGLQMHPQLVRAARDRL